MDLLRAEAVLSLDLSSSGNRLLSSSADWTVRCWYWATSNLLRAFEDGHTGYDALCGGCTLFDSDAKRAAA